MLLACLTALAGPTILPWATDRQDDSVRLAIIGDLPQDDTALARTVLARDPGILVFTGLTGDADLSAWDIGPDRPVIALPAGPPRKPWLKRFDGIGVAGLPKPVPYGSVDLVTGGTRWRVLYLTTWRTPGRQWDEQSYWIPKVLDRDAYERLLVFADGPVHTLAESAVPSPGADYLLDRIQDGADPLSFAGIISGNTGTNEVFSPGGRFGELHLVAGNSGTGPGAFTRAGGGGLVRRKELEPAYAGALDGMGLGPERYSGVSGFWMLELSRGDAVLDFWMARDGDWEVVYRFVRDKQGWHLP